MADQKKSEEFRKLAEGLRDRAAAEAELLEKKAELALIALKGLTTLRKKVADR